MVEPKRVNRCTQTRKCIYSTDSNTNNKPDRECQTLTFGEFKNVNLTQVELDKLNSRWKSEQVASMIENLSGYLVNTRKKYNNHYAVLLNWLKKDFPENSQADKQPTKPTLIEEAWCHG